MAGSTFPALEELKLETLVVCAESFPVCSESRYHQDRKIPASLCKVEHRYQLIFFEGRHLGEKKKICNR